MTATVMLRYPLQTVKSRLHLMQLGLEYVTAKNRKNYGGTSPVTRASGKKKTHCGDWPTG
jgi:hypothetical protein